MYYSYPPHRPIAKLKASRFEISKHFRSIFTIFGLYEIFWEITINCQKFFGLSCRKKRRMTFAKPDFVILPFGIRDFGVMISYRIWDGNKHFNFGILKNRFRTFFKRKIYLWRTYFQCGLSTTDIKRWKCLRSPVRLWRSKSHISACVRCRDCLHWKCSQSAFKMQMTAAVRNLSLIFILTVEAH